MNVGIFAWDDLEPKSPEPRAYDRILYPTTGRFGTRIRTHGPVYHGRSTIPRGLPPWSAYRRETDEIEALSAEHPLMNRSLNVFDWRHDVTGPAR